MAVEWMIGIDARFNRIPKIRNQIQIELTARTNWMARKRKKKKKKHRFRSSHSWNMLEFDCTNRPIHFVRTVSWNLIIYPPVAPCETTQQKPTTCLNVCLKGISVWLDGCHLILYFTPIWHSTQYVINGRTLPFIQGVNNCSFFYFSLSVRVYKRVLYGSAEELNETCVYAHLLRHRTWIKRAAARWRERERAKERGGTSMKKKNKNKNASPTIRYQPAKILNYAITL